MNTTAAISLIFLNSTTTTTTTRATQVQNTAAADFKALRNLLNFYTSLVIRPTLGWVGIFGNLIGAILIRTIGLHKSSNCLIFGLAIADLCYSVYNGCDVGGMIAYFNWTVKRRWWAWYLSYTSAYVCFISRQFLWVVASASGSMSTYITVLISVERLLAVFLPLHFSRLVTPRRSTIAMSCCLVIATFSAIFEGTLYKFRYSRTGGFGYMQYANLFERHVESYAILRKHVKIYIDHIIPLAIVLVSSVCISIKISMATRKREELLNSGQKRSTGQTTRTLLVVCSVFAVYKLLRVLHNYTNALSTHNNMFQLGLDNAKKIMIQVNHSVNFFIYIVMNKRFRSAFLELMNKKRRN